MRPIAFLTFCCGIGSLAVALMLAQPSQPPSQGASGQSGSGQSTSSTSQPPKKDTVARPMTEREKKKQEAKLKKELETPWKNWLNQEVVYIITDEEKKTFSGLKTDEEREQFVEQFWLRRDPTPDTEENEYKEEHYRRIAYANEHYASGIPGWKTDRGRIYIEYGPPDEIDSHPSGGTYDRPYEEGGGTTSTYPFEKWRYRYIEGVGTNVELEFVDTTMTGEYHFTIDPSEKDALLYVPGAGLTMMEQMGMACKTQRFQRTDGTALGTGSMPLPESMQEFTRIQLMANIFKPPAVKYKDLEEAVNSTIKYNLLPMKVRADYVPITDSSVLTMITIQFERKDLQWKQKDNISTANLNLYGRVTTMAGRPANWFEEAITQDLPSEMLQQAETGSEIYQKQIPLKPGRYRLNVAAKDIVGGNQTTYVMALDVPRIDEDKLSASSLILADLIEKVPTKSIGVGPFVIGTSKVRPRMDSTFKLNDKLGIYLQLYNFQPDEKTHKPEGIIEYDIVKSGTADSVFHFSEPVTAPGNEGGASQVTIEKRLPLVPSTFQPGNYTLNIKILDKNRNQTLSETVGFKVI
jgi:GWxTD domain-containing protein